VTPEIVGDSWGGRARRWSRAPARGVYPVPESIKHAHCLPEKCMPCWWWNDPEADPW